MDEIKVLPKSLRIQLSAEYNISSVVHCINQLVINSLDAKSTAIAVRFNLNSNTIHVIDNGFGFTEQNLCIVGVRYATSKYQSIHKTENNQILFPSRGITLSDIIHLSKTVKITSRTSNSQKTLCKVFEYDEPRRTISIVKHRSSVGTTISVCNFLFNKPVRNKCVNFDTLQNDIEKEMKYIALRNPQTSFSLRNDATGVIIFQIAQTNLIYKSILTVYDCIKSSFKKISFHQGNIKVTGLINIQKYPQNILQLLYLNRRHFKDARLHKIMKYMLDKSSIEKHQTEEKQHYYLYMISIDCPFTEFDIIDYNELKVEFKDFEDVIKCIITGVYNFLLEHNLLKKENTDVFNGSPISVENLDIRVSQVDGIVRGIPTKRKLDNSQIDFKEIINKVQKLDDESNKDVVLDKFCASLETYGPEKNITNKTTQTNTVEFNSKACQTDDNIFKKPLMLPPKAKPKLLERKTELIHVQINKSALELFNPKKTLQNTCSKLKTRIYQEHLIDNKYQDEVKKIKAKHRLSSKINTPSTSIIKKRYTQMKITDYKPRNCYISEPKKHVLSLFQPILNRNKICFSNKELNIQPFKFCKQSIYNLQESNKFRKWHESKLQPCNTSKYIYFNSDNIVSTSIKTRKRFCKRKNIPGVQLPQLLPHIKRSKLRMKNTLNNQLKNDSIISRRIKRYNFNCKTQVTFNSHSNVVTKRTTKKSTTFSFKNNYQEKDETPITILESNILNNNNNNNLLITSQNSNINDLSFINDGQKKDDTPITILEQNLLQNNKTPNNYNNSLIDVTQISNINNCQENEHENKTQKSNSINFSFINSEQNMDDTEITMLEQKCKTPEMEIVPNFYCNDNYKNIYQWLENSKSFTPSLNNTINLNQDKCELNDTQKSNTTNLSVKSKSQKCKTPEIEMKDPNENSNTTNNSAEVPDSILENTSKNNSSIEISDTFNEIDFSFMDNNVESSKVEDISNTLKDNTENNEQINDNIQTLLTNMNNSKNVIKMTPLKLNDPVYNSPITTITPEIIEEETNSIHLIKTEWQQNKTQNGTPYYINKRTGMTTFEKPKSLELYSITIRQTYLPKGMSPILNTSNIQLNELTPNARKILHQTMANTEQDELQNIKWMNYFQNNDSKQFFANLYPDKKHFETEIAKLNKYPKKIQTAFDNYCFTKDDLKNIIVINQYDRKFIVAIIRQNVLVVFDQHAVHERICLEKLIKDYQLNDKLKTCKCNKSILISLQMNEIKMLKKNQKLFQNWGLFYEIFGSKIKVKQIPFCWRNKNDNQNTLQLLILRLIQDFMKDSCNNTSIPLIILNTIKSEACRSAIKFGDQLTLEQCTKMINDLSECDLPFQCAHGRPSIIPILELINSNSSNNSEFEEGQKIHLNNLINFRKNKTIK